MSIRRSQRIAGQGPDHSTDLAKLISLRNTRRGLLGYLTRVANQILSYLNDQDASSASTLHNTLVETYLKFRAANTEYLIYETDERRIQECTETEAREANRIAEIEHEIRTRLRTPNLSNTTPDTSLYDVDPSETSNISGHDERTNVFNPHIRIPVGSSGNSPTFSHIESPPNSAIYHSPVHSQPLQRSLSQVRFTPCPPSVSSVTAKPRSSFRRLRQKASTTSGDNRSEPSTATVTLANANSYTKPKPPYLVFRPVDQFIDELTEGEETCLAGLSNPLTANSALRFEFETKALPTIELVKFSGDSSKWPDFVENFSRRVHYKLSFTDNDRMERLLSILIGEAKKSVECIGTSGIFYATALKTLKRDFGNKTVVTHSKLRNLLDKPQLPSDDRSSLKRFHQHLKSTVTWLKMIGNMGAIHSAENLSRAVIRLPDNLRKAFYRTSKDYEDTSLSLMKLESWLDSKLKEFYNPIADIIAQEEQKPKDKRKDKRKEGQSNYLGGKGDSKTPVCYVCNEPHKLWRCERFKQKSIAERRGEARKLNLCYNCLSKGHSIKDCKFQTRCKECQRKHHTLLHDPNYKANPLAGTKEGESHYAKSKRTTFLQIVPVTISNGDISEKVNVLLDPGSDTTLISASLVDRLKLPNINSNLKVSISNVLTKRQTLRSRSVNFLLSSCDSSVHVEDAWVVESLNIKMKPYNVSKMKKQYQHLRDASLPQPLDKDVEILIGADVPEALLHLEFIKGESSKEPIAVRTLLGWTIFGGKSGSNDGCSNYISVQSLDSKLERFWSQETYATTPDSEALLTRDEKRALHLLKNNTRLVNNHFEVGMLWKSDDLELVNNRPLAVTRLLSTERRLEKLPEIKQIYSSKLEDYVKIGHVQELTKDEAAKTSSKTNYIPHHFVLEPNKPGKIRIVWDASARFKGTSLNDQLLKGPDLLNSLVTVLSKFRRGKIAVMSDVEKMFHQVLVPEEDTDSLRFLWRKNEEHISEFKILVHPFGKKDSPCCANWALKGCANKIQDVPEGEVLKSLTSDERAAVTKAVSEEFYMDDFLGSFDSTNEAVNTCSNLVRITAERGFRLTKWISNDTEFLKAIPKEDLSPKITNHDFKVLPSERTLGVRWNPTDDVFFFNVPVKECKETKRGLLSFLCSIFDPLGFLAPYLIAPKLMLQSLGKKRLDGMTPFQNGS
ncbi:uncharacterized protein [Clytia hemisphaerica]|uniref:uncharacterized protein n=1 Tax=Clytia hemisphaerica TaxID=252671 RepID=UPI0034D77EF9